MDIDVVILAAEPSGDLHGAALIEALLTKNPRLKIAAVAGPRMRQFPISSIGRMEELQVMGFTDVVAALPRLYLIFRRLRNAILRQSPKTVVCIDYPGFHLRLERSLRRHGYTGRLIHTICPTVWAYGKGRIATMAQNLDLLLTIFPFEKSCFAHTPLQVEYIGHPLVKKIASHTPMPLFHQHFGLDPSKKILAIFPGSRETEIRRNLPIQIKAARLLAAQFSDLQIAVSLADSQLRPLFASVPWPIIDPERSVDLMKNAHLALATSGTVTLELCLSLTPAVVNFAIRPFDVFLAQKIFRIDLPHYCIVNIMMHQTVYPELFGPNLTVESMKREAEILWTDLSAREKCLSLCKEARAQLGSNDAAKRAAELILGN